MHKINMKSGQLLWILKILALLSYNYLHSHWKNKHKDMTPADWWGVAIIRNLKIQSGSRKVCKNAGCLLKKKDFNSQNLAEFIIGTLAGASVESMFSESEKTTANPKCTQCAMRIMQGRKAFLTESEWDHLDNLGHWHHRRQRRKERWRNLSH